MLGIFYRSFVLYWVRIKISILVDERGSSSADSELGTYLVMVSLILINA